MTAPLEVVEAAVTVADALQRHGLPHALGGAIALGVWGVPRGTVDVDIDVFVGADRHEELAAALIDAGCTFDRDVMLRQAREGDTVVVRLGPWRVDLFLPTIPFYEEAARRVQVIEFLGRPTPFIDAETLSVFKLLFFRGKDIVDLERLVAARTSQRLDTAWVRAQIVDMMGDDDPRVREWDRIVAEHAPTPG